MSKCGVKARVIASVLYRSEAPVRGWLRSDIYTQKVCGNSEGAQPLNTRASILVVVLCYLSVCQIQNTVPKIFLASYQDSRVDEGLGYSCNRVKSRTGIFRT